MVANTVVVVTERNRQTNNNNNATTRSSKEIKTQYKKECSVTAATAATIASKCLLQEVATAAIINKK